MTITLNTKNITTQEEALIHFIQTMDIEMINAYLDDDLTYQDFEKYVFISKLQIAFDKFRNCGDMKLFTYAGKCNSCNKGCKGFSFVGNISNNYMDVVIESTDGKIKDLYECADFKNDTAVFTKNKRIYINKFELNSDFL